MKGTGRECECVNGALLRPRDIKKMDIFSQSDPYVKVRGQGGGLGLKLAGSSSPLLASTVHAGVLWGSDLAIAPLGQPEVPHLEREHHLPRQEGPQTERGRLALRVRACPLWSASLCIACAVGWVWRQLAFEVWDKDAVTRDDIVGSFSIDISEAWGKVRPGDSGWSTRRDTHTLSLPLRVSGGQVELELPDPPQEEEGVRGAAGLPPCVCFSTRAPLKWLPLPLSLSRSRTKIWVKCQEDDPAKDYSHYEYSHSLSITLLEGTYARERRRGERERDREKGSGTDTAPSPSSVGLLSQGPWHLEEAEIRLLLSCDVGREGLPDAHRAKEQVREGLGVWLHVCHLTVAVHLAETPSGTGRRTSGCTTKCSVTTT